MTERVETVVVGAGITGLAYAHGRMARTGTDLLVLEAEDRVGGVIRTARSAGSHWECGPEALQDNEPEVNALFDELGLAPSRAADVAARRYVLCDGTRLLPVPTSPKALLASALLSWRGKAALLAGLLRKHDDDLAGSLAHFARARFGEEVLRRLVDPAVSGIWAGDPELLSFAAALPELHAGLKQHGSLTAFMKAKAAARRSANGQRKGPPSLISAAGGLDVLPRALGAALGDRLVTSCPVERVAAEGHRWRVDGAGRSILAERCVVALPAARAASVFAESEPALSQPLSSVVGENVVSIAHVWRRKDLAHPLDGFGYLVPSSLGRMHLGTLFSSSIQPSRAAPDTVVLRTLVGGAQRPELLAADDESLRRLLVEDVGPLLGALPGAAPQQVHISRWPSVKSWKPFLSGELRS